MAVRAPSPLRPLRFPLALRRLAAVVAAVGGVVALAVGVVATLQEFAVPVLAAPAAASTGLSSYGPTSLDVAGPAYDLARPGIALLLLAGGVGLMASWRGARDEPALWGFGGVCGGFLAMALGYAGVEWAGRALLSPSVFGLAFLLGFVGSLGVVAGAAVLGVLAWRRASLPRGSALALMAAPGGFVLTILLPSSAWIGLLWLGAVWVALGLSLRFEPHPAPAAADEGAASFAQG